MSDSGLELDCEFVSYEIDVDNASIKRLVGIIMGHAIQSGAREIRLHPRSKRGGFKVFYRLEEGDELQEQMNLHREVSKSLRAHLKALSGEGSTFSIALQNAEHQISIAYEFKLRAEDSTYGETLILMIQPAHPYRAFNSFPNFPTHAARD